MRMKIYQQLVNKHLGISQRYHKLHDNAGKMTRILSWGYLLWLNFAYTFLFCHFLGKGLDTPIYEEKKLRIGEGEQNLTPEEFAEKLRSYDIVSFDIFDTLIYRPFSSPTDLFYLIGMELEYMDFARIRAEVEIEARQKKHREENTSEVTLSDIWKLLEKRTGLDAEYGMSVEIKYEMEFCYANPYMYKVYNYLRARNTRIIYTSDMYLPEDVLLSILEKNGYDKNRLFLSCKVNKNKGSGELFCYVKETLGKENSYVHVGDNMNSDVKRAKQNGFATFPVTNPNQSSVLFRAHDMSPIIGGAYRGIVNNRLYCGLYSLGKYYEYGFIYGGLFVLGYCHFIHEYCENHGINKILFLARDGEIIQKVYNLLYPDEATDYVYISRMAASKMTAGYDKYDYQKKMVYHKVNQGYTLEKLLKSMELEPLFPALDKEKQLSRADKLSSDNVKDFIAFLDKHWKEVLTIYQPQREAAGIYFKQFIKDNDKVAAVDIGWAGTGAMAIRTMVKKEWKINAEVVGIIAGTNTVHNAEPFMSEGYLLDGQIVSYLYSSGFNRDLWKKHNPGSGYNLYFELLTSSEKESLKGYYPGETSKDIMLSFLEKEQNPEGIREIQFGILDFAKDYIMHFSKYPYMFKISGRDAYAPMLVAASHNEKYLKDIYEDFNLKIDIGV